MTRHHDLGASATDVAVDGDAGTVHVNGKHLPDVWLRLEIAVRNKAPGIPRSWFGAFCLYVRKILATCKECSQRSDGWETAAPLTLNELLFLDMKVVYPILHGVKFDLGPEETDPIRE